MIFISLNQNNEINVIHYMPFDDKYGLGKTEEELLQEGILINSIPEPEQVEGKVPILKYNGTDLYYEYVDAPVDEMTALKNKIESQEQALAETNATLLDFMEASILA